MSFLLDDWQAIAGWFEYWMDIIINPFNDYIEDYNPLISSGYVEIIPVDKNFNYGSKYKFYEAYPVQILPMEFDVINKNATMRYEVMFNCTEYFFEGDNYTTRARSDSPPAHN